MAEILHVLQGWLALSRRRRCDVRRSTRCLRASDLAARVAGLAEDFRDLPQVIGLLGAQWHGLGARQLAGLGRRQDRGAVAHVLQPPAARARRRRRRGGACRRDERRVRLCRLARRRHDVRSRSDAPILFPRRHRAPASSSTRQAARAARKGVRLGLEQIDWQARALATAIDARSDDLNLSVLPLALLLETITAICVPVLVGARTHFASAVAESVGAGRPAGLLEAFEAARPDYCRARPAIALGLDCRARSQQQAGAGQLALRRGRRRARRRQL